MSLECLKWYKLTAENLPKEPGQYTVLFFVGNVERASVATTKSKCVFDLPVHPDPNGRLVLKDSMNLWSSFEVG